MGGVLQDYDDDYDVKVLNLFATLPLLSFISFSRKSAMVTLDYPPLDHCLNYLETQVSYYKKRAHSVQH